MLTELLVVHLPRQYKALDHKHRWVALAQEHLCTVHRLRCMTAVERHIMVELLLDTMAVQRQARAVKEMAQHGILLRPRLDTILRMIGTISRLQQVLILPHQAIRLKHLKVMVHLRPAQLSIMSLILHMPILHLLMAIIVIYFSFELFLASFSFI